MKPFAYFRIQQHCIAALVVAMSFLCCAHQANAQAKNSVKIQFIPVLKGQPLCLDTCSYMSALGQPFTLTRLKYLFGQMQLFSSKRQLNETSGYFLFDAAEPKTSQVVLTVPANEQLERMSFLLGVDSASNCNGAQSGALDPIEGMFWTWNTGYIFFKLEGASPASKDVQRQIEYHVGGYREPNNCIRWVTINLPSRFDPITEIAVEVDLSEFFDSTEPIDFSKLHTVNDFHNATLLADRWMRCFKLKAVK